MSHEYVYKISSRYLQKWLRYDIKHVINSHFSRHSGTLPWFSEFCFFTDFDASKSVLGSFFAFFAKIWPKNMYRSSKSRFFLVWPFSPGDLRWPWPVLWSQSTRNDTYRCQWHYPCRFIGFVLRLTSKFYSPMSPSPKSLKFWLWPDLWRHQWLLGQIFDLVRVVHVQGYRMAFEIWKSVQ